MRYRVAISALFVLIATSLAGQQPAEKPAAKTVPTLVVRGVGRGVVPLDGSWQFHLGDNSRWATASFDDSNWEQIEVDAPWGAQNHPSYAGFAWYRRHLEVQPTSGATQDYRLLISHAEDAYEVYWNGVLIGSYGKLPPHPSWYYAEFPRSFPLTGSAYGVLAIRVWKAPLESFSSEYSGGLYAAPLVGDPDTITLKEKATYWSYVREDLFDYSLILLRCFVALLCVMLWTRNRREHLFIWVAVLTATPVALEMLQRLFLIPFSYGVARFLNQPLYAVYHISLWFLLVWLLRLNDNRTLVRWTRILAGCMLIAGFLDGALAYFWGSAGLWMQLADGFLTTFLMLVEIFPFVLIGAGFRRRLDASRWVVAISATLLRTIDTVADASALGQRFTHWSLFSDIIDTPLFVIQGVAFRAEKVASIALFLSILFAVYRYALERQVRQNALEQEMQSAREIQQVLIPETLPSLVGYAVTSAYQPAQEVGGDFFQILSNPDGSTLIALGDVSGKGLKAAMNVSMIVGVLRALSDVSSSPKEILGGLNRCLCGRMQGGFTTALILRLGADCDPAGSVTIANAGHLPPFLNYKELMLEGSLPLGLAAFASYDEITLRLHPGDYLSLYTDGLLEARSANGELYGFERMHRLLAAHPTAQQATEAAVAFGQEDDITVLTLTRLAAGEESSTSLVAPFLTPQAVTR
ncbi:PP2C family protein-serine/threonine phosphatase [Acidicapsa ligni]|uniref:PP2C family protein-serine/threonine phosphatase n=1 Tax=Acidicapsa ligni TaxID=542300 RepID=UPI0021DF4F3C|nr:SpoIIE family protein phosphatase [Acidicapsa ligni]